MTKRMMYGFAAFLASISVVMTFGRVQAQNLVQNGDFETILNASFSGGPSNPNGNKMFFATANPKFWSNAPGSGSNYTYVCAPRTADGAASGGNPFPVYGPFPFSSAGGTTPVTSDAGGNFIQQDADPNFNDPITQSISIPSAGQYVLSFDEAGGQQDHPNYTSPTTELWNVTLGAAGTQSSPGFSLPGPLTSGGTLADVGQWHSVSKTFNVTSPGSYLLEFVGAGTPSGQPPIIFLDNVSLVAVPEPATLAIIGIGLVGSVACRKLRRAKAEMAC